jgi:hypothetical protein
MPSDQTPWGHAGRRGDTHVSIHSARSAAALPAAEALDPGIFLGFEPTRRSRLGRGRKLHKRFLGRMCSAPTQVIHVPIIVRSSILDVLALGEVGEPAIPCLRLDNRPQRDAGAFLRVNEPFLAGAH